MSASWILVPCLVSLRGEFSKLAPNRDHESDGAVGNQAHATSISDHNPDESGRTPYEDADHINEVHAIDVDDDLRKANWDMGRAVQIIVLRHRNGQDNRLQNVIYNRQIWSRSWGWTAKAYNGASPHTEHGHFSARYTTAQESDTRPWGLLAADKLTTTRKVTMIEFGDVKLPELKEDDRDPLPGISSQYVKRVQAMLNWLLPGEAPLKVDGWYGEATSAGVKTVMKGYPVTSSKDGSKVGKPEWKRLYGI